MAKTNYNKMSNKNKEDLEPVIEEVVTEVDPDVEETIVEVEESVTETTEGTIEEVKKGIVIGCSKLNVRNNPAITAKVVCVIAKDTEVEVIENMLHGDFYYVRKGTPTEGFSGYCMKKYISIK